MNFHRKQPIPTYVDNIVINNISVVNLDMQL